MKIENLAYEHKQEYMDIVNPKKVPVIQKSPDKEITGVYCIKPYIMNKLIVNIMIFIQYHGDFQILENTLIDQDLSGKQKGWIHQLLTEIDHEIKQSISDQQIQNLYQITEIIEQPNTNNLKEIRALTLNDETLKIAENISTRLLSFIHENKNTSLSIHKKIKGIHDIDDFYVDIITNDTYYDIYIGNSLPSKMHYISLVFKYAVGLQTSNENETLPENIAFYNPRKNIIYSCPVAMLDSALFFSIQKDILKIPESKILSTDSIKAYNLLITKHLQNSSFERLKETDIPLQTESRNTESKQYEAKKNNTSDSTVSYKEYIPKESTYYTNIKTKDHNKAKIKLFFSLLIIFIIGIVLIYMVLPDEITPQIMKNIFGNIDILVSSKIKMLEWIEKTRS